MPTKLLAMIDGFTPIENVRNKKNYMVVLRPRVLIALVAGLAIACPPALALENPEQLQENVGLVQNHGRSVDFNLPFRGSDGVERPLREFVASGKPILLVPVYYHCPRLCGLLLSGTIDLLRKLELRLGDDYQVLTVSFDPEDTPETAGQRAAEQYEKLAAAGSTATAQRAAGSASDSAPGYTEPMTSYRTEHWRFLVGSAPNITTLMESIGFKYQRDKGEFAHTAAIIVLTPQGEISQYFTGIEFPAWDVKLALIEASKGKIGSFMDHVLLFCFRFDPTKGKYTWAAYNFMKAGGLLTIMGLAAVVYVSGRKTQGLK